MLFTRLKRLLIGEPLASQLAAEEKLPKWKALAVLSSDAFSSVAYATEEMLLPLAAVSLLATAWTMPIAIAIALLLAIVAISYRQTLRAYPQGGGAYVVARENLGVNAGLVAGAALLIEYVLTVAVSVAAGTAALTSAFPALLEHRVMIGLVMVAVITLMNLRGVRAAGVALVLPTYLFFVAFLLMIGTGAWHLAIGQHVRVAPIIHRDYPEIMVFLLARAFSSGCAALTGIETISTAVTQFEAPVSRNAKITLGWMAGIMAFFFLGITALMHVYGVMPEPHVTAVSNLARQVFGDASTGFYLVQGATMLILVLAANTAYNGFPILCSVMAKDRFLPRQFASLGDKLVFSNGILGLSLAAGVLLAIFEGDTHALVPLYAVGVFISFTLSQAGMVVNLRRQAKPGHGRAMLTSAVGAATTLLVLLVISVTKFAQGAWVVILLIPVLIVGFREIRRHYLAVGKELSLIGQEAPKRLEKMRHAVIVPISGIHRGVLDALRYGISISDDVRACYVELDPETTERVQSEWNRWAHEVPFVVLKSPYRSVISPLIEYINDIEQTCHNDLVTVIIPEFVTTRWWHRLLHNQTALLIRTALLFKRNKVVTSVRYHLTQG
jgi:amino acid transporter